MPWKPEVPGEIPTLGFKVIDWITDNLAAPDQHEYMPFRLYREQEEFILNWYSLNPHTCTFRYTRGVLCRPRGWGKSPLLAALALVEAIGPCVPDGWDAAGQPVAMHWSDVRTPMVHVCAVSRSEERRVGE